MLVTINGQKKEFQENASLKELVGNFCQESSHVIAELNGGIVPGHQWTTTRIKDGDILELVTFVGGG
jgi:sulfur carrier protein